MINNPPVDLLIEQLGTEGQPVSRYCLCVVAAKRARQIIGGEEPFVATKQTKPLSIAIEELDKGQIKIMPDEN